MICSNTVGQPNPTVWDMKAAVQMLDELPADPVHHKPYRAPAIIESAEDFGEETAEIETACRILGKDCTYELQQVIHNRKLLVRTGVHLPAEMPSEK